MAVRLGKLSRALMRRSIRLLDMEYKPSEIAEELDASKEQIRKLIHAGAPARMDAKGNYWIHGERFAEWLKNAAPKNDKAKKVFEDNEAYCFACKAVTTFTEYRRKNRVVFGTCLHGHKVARFISSKPATPAKPEKKGKKENAKRFGKPIQ